MLLFSDWMCAPLMRALSLTILVGLTACDAPPAKPRTAAAFYKSEYAGAGRVNALGDNVTLEQYSGNFIWVDYAAEWCAACQPQTMAVKSVSRSGSRGVVFVTVMTSEPQGYGHPATEVTAARWAARLGLDPSRVLAADLTSMKLPRHILYSPRGEALFDHTGQLSAAQIQATLEAEIR